MTIYKIKNIIKVAICACVFHLGNLMAMELQAHNIGQGNCNLVKYENKIVIFDCGSVTNSLRALLSNEEITVPFVFISHMHSDHVSGLTDIVNTYTNAFQNTVFYLGGDENKWRVSSADYVDKLRRSLREPNVIYLAKGGYQLPQCITIYPLPIERSRPNSWSQIIKLTYAGKSILFTGDADYDIASTELGEWSPAMLNYNDDDNIDAAEQYLSGYSQFLQGNHNFFNNIISDIVILPHHGSCSHYSYTFHQLAKYAEHTIICSTMDGNHKLPKPQVLASLAQISPNKSAWLTGNVVDCSGNKIENTSQYLSFMILAGLEVKQQTPFFGAWLNGNQALFGGKALGGEVHPLNTIRLKTPNTPKALTHTARSVESLDNKEAKK